MVSDLKDLAGLQVEALEHLHGLILGDVLLVDDVLLVVWVHVLVKAPEAVGRGADLDVEIHVGEPDALQGLHEGLRRVLRDHAAVLRDGQELLLPLLVGAGSGLALRLLRHAVGVGDEALALDDAGLPEVDLLLVQLALRHHGVDVGLAALHVALEADGQQGLVVAGGLAGDAVGEADGDDVIVHALHGVLWQGRSGDVLHGLAFPVREVLEDQFLVLRCDVVRILGADRELIQLLQIKLGAGLEFRVQVGAPVTVRRGADDELVLHDQSGHALHDVVHDLGPEEWDRVAREFLIGFGGQHQALRRDGRSGVQHLLPHPDGSFCQHACLLRYVDMQPADARRAAGRLIAMLLRIIHSIGIGKPFQ